jgi:gas vesicle protein
MQRKKNILQAVLIGIALGALAGLLFAEGTVVETKTYISPVKYTLAWTASTNGIVSQTTTFYVRGEIARVSLNGTSTGATYSLTLKDSSGIDVLAGLGSGVSTSAVSSVVPGIKITDSATTNVVPYVVNDLLTLGVTVAGSNKTGTVILYVK